MIDDVTQAFESMCSRNACLGFLWTESRDKWNRRIALCFRCKWTIPLPPIPEIAA